MCLPNYHRDFRRVVLARIRHQIGELSYSATMWPSFERFTGLDDPALWTATSYCPPVELRIDLLGVPRGLAEQHFQTCRNRVAAARPAQP